MEITTVSRILLFTSLLLACAAAPAWAADYAGGDADQGNQVAATAPLEAGGDGMPAARAATQQTDGFSGQSVSANQDPAPARTPMAVAAGSETTTAHTTPAYAAENQPLKLRDYEDPKPAPQDPWWQQVAGFLFKLAIVIGMIFASLGAIKKFTGGNLALPTSKGRNMAVLESLQLAPQQSVHLISLGGERLLVVGTSPAGVNVLSEISDPAQMKPFLNSSRPNASAFNQVFDLESVGADTHSDLYAETMRDMSSSVRRAGSGWPKS